MFALLTTILLAYHYTLPALTAPHKPPHLERRTASLAPPTITTTIRSANGTDVTSSFNTLVYYQQPDDITPPATNLTDRQPAAVRLMNFCRSPRAEFLGSHCVHSRGSQFSLREYTVQCRQPQLPPYRLMMAHNFTGYPQDEQQYFSEQGTCLDHEICVNSMPRERGESGVPVATCVATKEFLEDPGEEGWIHGEEKGEGSKTGSYVGDVLRAVAAKKAGIVVSRQDASTPIELDSLEVDVGAEGAGGKMVQQTCRDCFGLRTHTAAPNADSLKIEATLMATAAMSGLVWVTVFAG